MIAISNRNCLPYENTGVTLGFVVWSVLLIIFSFQCCVFNVFFFVLCFVPNMGPVSGLSIIDCPFGFLYRLYYNKQNTYMRWIKYTNTHLSVDRHLIRNVTLSEQIEHRKVDIPYTYTWPLTFLAWYCHFNKKERGKELSRYQETSSMCQKLTC